MNVTVGLEEGKDFGEDGEVWARVDLNHRPHAYQALPLKAGIRRKALDIKGRSRNLPDS